MEWRYALEGGGSLTVEEAENRDDVAGIFEIREVGSEPSSKYSEGRIVR